MPPSSKPSSARKGMRRVRARPEALAFEDQGVAEQAAERVARAGRDRRRDEAVDGIRQQWHLGERSRAQDIGIAVAPVLVDERAVAQVADAAAAPAQEAAEGPRLGQGARAAAATWTPCASGAPRCGEPSEITWRTRSTQAAATLAGPVAGAARDQAAHRVPDERDPSTSTGQAATSSSSSSASDAAVLGDVAAAVVADLDRGHVEIPREAGAVGLPAPRSRQANSVSIRPWRNTTRRGRRRREGRRERAPARRPPHARRRAPRAAAAARCPRAPAGRRSGR